MRGAFFSGATPERRPNHMPESRTRDCHPFAPPSPPTTAQAPAKTRARPGIARE
jgi:hypothetical protein